MESRICGVKVSPQCAPEHRSTLLTFWFFALSSSAFLLLASLRSATSSDSPSSEAKDASRALALPIKSPLPFAVVAEASLSLPALAPRSTARELARCGEVLAGEEGSGKSRESRRPSVRPGERFGEEADAEAEMSWSRREGDADALERSREERSEGRVRFLGGVEILSLASLFGGLSGRPSLPATAAISISVPSRDRTVLLALLNPSLDV